MLALQRQPLSPAIPSALESFLVLVRHVLESDMYPRAGPFVHARKGNVLGPDAYLPCFQLLQPVHGETVPEVAEGRRLVGVPSMNLVCLPSGGCSCIQVHYLSKLLPFIMKMDPPFSFMPPELRPIINVSRKSPGGDDD